LIETGTDELAEPEEEAAIEVVSAPAAPSATGAVVPAANPGA
jgi:hypothetical protein